MVSQLGLFQWDGKRIWTRGIEGVYLLICSIWDTEVNRRKSVSSCTRSDHRLHMLLAETLCENPHSRVLEGY